MGFKAILCLVYVTLLRPKQISRASIALLGTFLCKLNDLSTFVVFGHRMVFRSQLDVHALLKYMYDHTVPSPDVPCLLDICLTPFLKNVKFVKSTLCIRLEYVRRTLCIRSFLVTNAMLTLLYAVISHDTPGICYE